MKVKIKKLSSDAVIPKYSKHGDAGMDLVATRIISYNGQVVFGTDLAFEIPEGFVGYVFPRSSIRNTHYTLANSVGVIDSGYRGELQVTFNINEMKGAKSYQVGDRIAQLIIMPIPPIEFEEVEELSDTERGEGGFGSTGK
jgi:dUTP pyrophosphatase